MFRANLLIAKPEPPESFSARKLVVETTKFNVITAYSVREASELLRKFPALLLATHTGPTCTGVDHRISSHSPEDLLQLLRKLFGDPRPKPSQPTTPRRIRSTVTE